MNKTILVTGGAGFIGSNFIYLLLEERPEWKIVCVDLLTYAANIHTLDGALKNPGFRFYKEDIRNRDGIFRIFETEKPDIVVNFAAESHVDRSIENPGIFLETNIIGTQVLMDACRKYGVARFHQVGTDEVYGDLPLDRPDLFFTEETPIRTSSPYSTSKASADLLALAYHRTYGLPVTVSRCSNNYGPYQFPEKLIPLMINNAMQDKPLPVYGQGLNVRDWLYVKDHCYGILAILEKGRTGEVYNLGGHNEKANIEIVKLILRELGKPESLITYVTDRKGHDLRYAIDPAKAQRELGWSPTTKFDDGIRLTIAWYRKNTEWLSECVSGEYMNYYKKMYFDKFILQ
ncbi:MAG: dTDP-glucose 4,6-dehydratase [Eubacteriales bacterium]|nr:dTDP-glucose 4,6-dehydratase [Eubacteriales bacterium]